jgi:hypothetical protein
VDLALPGDDHPARIALRAWLGEHPDPSPRELAESGYVAPHWPRPWGLGADPVAGMMQITPEMAAARMRPHWGVYFTVTDADTAAREAGKLGATICVPPRDIPGTGRFAGIISPQGVMFYVIKHGG